jgi:hypothetical protein
MENVQYTSVPIEVGVSILSLAVPVFMQENHNVSVACRIDSVLILSHIVGRVTDSHCLVKIDFIVLNV